MTSLPLVLAQLVLAAPELGPPGTGGVVAAALASTPFFRAREARPSQAPFHGDFGREEIPVDRLDHREKFEDIPVEHERFERRDKFDDHERLEHERFEHERFEHEDDESMEHMRRGEPFSDDYRRRTRDLDPRRAPVGSAHDGVHRVAERMPEIGDRPVVGPYAHAHEDVMEEHDHEEHDHEDHDHREAEEHPSMLERRHAEHEGETAVSSLSEAEERKAQTKNFIGDAMGFAKDVHENLYTVITFIDYPYLCPCHFVNVPGGRRMQKTKAEGGQCINQPNEQCGADCDSGGCQPGRPDSAGAVSLVMLTLGFVFWN